MNGMWDGFRGLPRWVQAIGWVAAWPLLVPLVIVNRSQERWATVVALVFALVATPVWVAAFVGEDEPTDRVAADPGSEDAVEQTSPMPSVAEPATAGSTSKAPASDDPEPSELSSGGSGARPDPSEVAAAASITVVDVTDGDTLVARDGSGQFRIRLAQVDAPETPNECFSAEAADALRSMVGAATMIELRRPSGPYTDPYGRRLGEVVTADGVSVSVELVRQGYAGWGSDFAGEDPDLADRMRLAQQEAREAGLGLWSACGGPHVTAAPPATSDDPAAEEPAADEPVAPDPAEQTNPWGAGSCHPAYEPCVPPPSETGDLNCPEIRQHHPSGVSVDHSHGDPHGLDGDQDGRGCE